MVKRKVLTTLIATPLSLMFIFSVFNGEWVQPLELLTMTGMFSLVIAPVVLLYGVPVTFLSDYLGKRLTGNKRIVTALVVHVLFGFLFGFILPANAGFAIQGVVIDAASIFAAITATFFWAVDELLRADVCKKFRLEKCCIRFAR